MRFQTSYSESFVFAPVIEPVEPSLLDDVGFVDVATMIKTQQLAALNLAAAREGFYDTDGSVDPLDSAAMVAEADKTEVSPMSRKGVDPFEMIDKARELDRKLAAAKEAKQRVLDERRQAEKAELEALRAAKALGGEPSPVPSSVAPAVAVS